MSATQIHNNIFKYYFQNTLSANKDGSKQYYWPGQVGQHDATNHPALYILYRNETIFATHSVTTESVALIIFLRNPIQVLLIGN